MSTQTDTGGPAFPSMYYLGMTLLDWFAGQLASGPMLSAMSQATRGQADRGAALAEGIYDVAARLIEEKRRREAKAKE